MTRMTQVFFTVATRTTRTMTKWLRIHLNKILHQNIDENKNIDIATAGTDWKKDCRDKFCFSLAMSEET